MLRGAELDNEMRTENAAAPSDARWDEPASVRLSPVEMRNLHLINDPALAGYDANPASSGADRLGVAHEGCGDARPSAASPERGCEELPGAPFGCYRYEVEPTGAARLLSYEGDKTCVEVPDEVDSHVVAELGEGLFRGHGEIESVTLPPELKRIGAHAFDECSALRRIELPPALEAIGSFAFAKAGLEAASIPASVHSIGEKAFFACKELRACMLPPDLREVGDEAFAYAGIQRVVLPAALERLGFHVFDHTPVQVHALEGAMRFSGEGGRYRIDERGGLYCGDELVELVSCVSSYSVLPGTRRIAARAFCRNGFIRRVDVPEGVREVGDEAFHGCRNLRRVSLPDSLESIGAMAFVGTALSSLRIGAGLRHVGDSAFLVQGRNPLRSSRALSHVEIDEHNEHFYLESGLLCQRGAGDGAGDLCLLYLGPENVVRIPASVNRIASCAFCGTSNVDELFVHGHLHSVCWEALSTVRSIPVIHVQFASPIDGYAGEDFLIPSLSARYRSITNLITTDERGTVFNFPYYDSWVAHVSSVEEFVPAAARRLMRPMCLSDRARELYLGILQRKRAKACRYCAKKGDMDALVFLCEAGVLGKEDVAADLDRATAERETQATACLLELMRRFGWQTGIDMSL